MTTAMNRFVETTALGKMKSSVVFAKSKPLCIVSRTAFRKLVKNGLKVTV
jgi:hypothetical protein